MNLRGFLEGVLNQVNPFDGGKTFDDARARSPITFGGARPTPQPHLDPATYQRREYLPQAQALPRKQYMGQLNTSDPNPGRDGTGVLAQYATGGIGSNYYNGGRNLQGGGSQFDDDPTYSVQAAQGRNAYQPTIGGDYLRRLLGR